MNITIYHNPRCSKSRQTLALLEEKGLNPHIVEYLKNAPSIETITHLLKLLGMSPRELMRKNEDEYKVLNLQDEHLSVEQLVKAMHETPKLIERPIVVVDDIKAKIGRPPEGVLALLD